MTLRAGKLPQEELANLLARVPRRDRRVLLGPGVGCDAAVIDIGGGRVLVATMDPVTFATDQIGSYAVHVNANDIACMGGRPAWFMATVLLPPGAADDLPRRIFQQLTTACDALGIELVGGHTEVTIGLDRPIVSGTMLGEATRGDVVTGDGLAAGDVVLLAGSIAVEGTALLAQEATETLVARGVPDETIARSRELLVDPGISVVRAAQTVCEAARPRIMHDPTEGGIATALHELAAAAGMTIRVDAAAIPVLPETQAVCDALALDPLGLIASGALLAVVAPDDAGRVIAALSAAKIDCRAIGATEYGPARVILASEESIPLRVFERDEFARFFDDTATG